MKVSLRITAAAIAVLLFSNIHSAKAETWNLTTSGVWNVAGNWTPASFPDAEGAVAIIPNNQTATRTITLGEDITVGSLTIDNPGTLANTIGQSNVFNPILTFDGAGTAAATLAVTGAFTGSAANPNVIRGPVVLASDLEISVAIASSGAYDRTILAFLGADTMTGPGGVTKTGFGRLVFADSPKAFQGPLAVNQGALRMNANGAVPSATSAVSVASGAQIHLDGHSAASYTFGGTNNTVITLNGLGLPQPPPEPGNPLYISGALRVNATAPPSSEMADRPTNFTAITNPIVLGTVGGNDVGITVVDGYNFSTNFKTPENLTLSGVISGAGRLVAGPVSGAPFANGTLVLTADNSHTGGTLIQMLDLVVAPGSDLGTGNVFVDGDTIIPGPLGPSLSAGTLRIQTGVADAIFDAATLTLTGDTALFNGSPDGVPGGFAILEAGINEIVGGLILGPPTSPMAQPTGTTHGSTLSGASRKSDAYFAGDGIVTIGFAGDFNDDGVVDAGDYIVWRKGLGTTYFQDDYALFTKNFGSVAPGGGGGSGAVPEPGMLVLIGLAVPMMLASRRKRS